MSSAVEVHASCLVISGVLAMGTGKWRVERTDDTPKSFPEGLTIHCNDCGGLRLPRDASAIKSKHQGHNVVYVWADGAKREGNES